MSKSLNIAVIAADLDPRRLGGAEHHCVEVVKRLANDHHIDLFVGNHDDIKSILPKKIKVIKVPHRVIPNMVGLSYIWSARSVIKNYYQYKKPDIFWAKQIFPQLTTAVIARKSYHVPIVATAQNPRLHFEELMLSHFHHQLSQLAAGLLDPIIGWSIKRADHIAAVSAYSEKLAIQYGAQQTSIIPNAVNLPTTTKKTKSNITHIVTTSALIDRNNIDTLIKAVAMLPKDMNWKLTIAGSGLLQSKLQSLAREQKCSRNICFVGQLPSNEVEKLLDEASIFIRLPYHEGFGVSLIEAMAHKVPVISTSVGGIPDFLSHNKTGIFVEPNSPNMAAQAIVKLATNEKFSDKLTKEAYNLIKTKYTWNAVSRQVDNILRNTSKQYVA